MSSSGLSKFRRHSIPLLVALALAIPASANGLWVRITDVQYPRVRLVLGWENGWGNDARTKNHDAIWLFCKGEKLNGDGHSSLLLEDVSILSGAFKDSISTDRIGAFIIPLHESGFRRDSCELSLIFSSNVIPRQFIIYGVEMVQVPSGAFYLGDGSSQFSWIKQDSTPILVDGKNGVTFGSGAGTVSMLGRQSQEFELSTDWPLGTNAFFLMKYELSQQQYLDFFNSQTIAQRDAIWSSREATNASFAIDEDVHRNGLIRNQSGFLEFQNDDKNGIFGDQGKQIACNYLNWDDLLAWLDWAGLRPITEFEFEKACRGPLPSLAKEFAWGTQKANNVTALVNSGFPFEAPANAIFSTETGNAVYGALFGQPYLNAPVRQGFAANDTSNRVSAGVGYYGAFELSGSIWEMCVKACPEAISFTAKPGDGELDSQGNHDENWPAAASAITRGGGCNSLIINNLTYGFRDLAVSDRFYHTLSPDQRKYTVGGRGGR